jgi:hypothetical protein
LKGSSKTTSLFEEVRVTELFLEQALPKQPSCADRYDVTDCCFGTLIQRCSKLDMKP